MNVKKYFKSIIGFFFTNKLLTALSVVVIILFIVAVAKNTLGVSPSSYLSLNNSLNNSSVAQNEVKNSNNQNVQSANIYWDKRIREIGGKAAYDQFKKDVVKEPFPNQHQLAHVFGRLLYEIEGIDGIQVCDDAIAFGCYHSFFGAAFLDKGLEVIPELDQACIQKHGPLGLGCPHGIGHGLVEYFGHSRKTLEQSLDLCSQLQWKGKLMGCMGGVFMEYNFPLNESAANGQSIREMTANAPLEPCNSLPEDYQYSCYFSQGEWWRYRANGDFQQMANWCNQLTKDNREACVLGIGYTIGPFTQWSLEPAKSHCDKLKDDYDRVICRAGVSWSFWSVPTGRPISEKLCQDGLDANQQSTCKQHSFLLEK